MGFKDIKYDIPVCQIHYIYILTERPVVLSNAIFITILPPGQELRRVEAKFSFNFWDCFPIRIEYWLTTPCFPLEANIEKGEQINYWHQMSLCLCVQAVLIKRQQSMTLPSLSSHNTWTLPLPESLGSLPDHVWGRRRVMGDCFLLQIVSTTDK